MRRLFFILFFLPLFAAGQSASTMRFEHEVWDFGTVREVDGPVEHTFTFTNSGRVAFVIEKVTVNCGCTTPRYSTEPVEPGGKGSITVRFDPVDREGAFEQSIGIVSKSARNRNRITVRGMVVARPRSVEEDYPFALAEGVRLSGLSLNFGYVEQGAAKSLSVRCMNTSSRPVKLEWAVQPARGFVRVEAPPILAPGARGEITVTYDLRHASFYGRYSDRVNITLNDTPVLLPISTTFTAVDPVPTSPGPDAVITPLFHHHGNARRGDKLTRTLEIANDGAKPLIVRWVGLRPGMTTTLRPGATIAPHAASHFTLTFDTSALPRGTQTGAITIITNDPIRPLRDIRSAVNLK